MGKRPTKEALIASYQMLYAKISSATAEVDGKKRIFRGQFKELFAEVPVSQGVITRFVWAISHSTKVLPTTLFSIKKDGNKGVIVERLHSGFYDNNRKHIVGTDLVPFIMQSASLHQSKPNKTYDAHVLNNKGDEKPVIVRTAMQEKIDHECEIMSCDINGTGLSGVSDDTLAYFGKDAQERYNKAKHDLDIYHAEVQRREKIRQDQLKLKQILDSMGMNKDELKALLK